MLFVAIYGVLRAGTDFIMFYMECVPAGIFKIMFFPDILKVFVFLVLSDSAKSIELFVGICFWASISTMMLPDPI